MARIAPFLAFISVFVLASGFPIAAEAVYQPGRLASAQPASDVVLVARDKHSGSEGVVAVKYPGGEFRKVGRNKWVENGRGAQFQFKQMADDGRTITLWDRSRNVFIYLNFRREKILYAADDEDPSDLYPMVRVIKNEPESDDEDDDSDEPDMPKRARYTCTEGVPMDVRFENHGDRSLAFVSIDGSPEMKLRQISSGSGAKYSNGKYTVWTKGRNAILEINGDTDVCTGR